MRFEVLGIDDPAWSSLVERLGPRHRDIHFLPSYAAIYERTYGFEPLLAVLRDGAEIVLQAFVKRPLNALPFLRDQGIDEPLFDVANPYGYGGPLLETATADRGADLFRAFNRELCAYFSEQRIAAEFTSMHPLLRNDELVGHLNLLPLVDQKAIVYVDLSISEDELWQQTRRGHRSNINKARRSGVTVEQVAPTTETFDAFNRLYLSTMDRHHAAERWYFPESYFRNCWEMLGAERMSFFFATHSGALAAAWILIHAFDTVYYHFGGSLPEFYSLRPNNLMVHEVALWAKRAGYRRLHLGGGVTSAVDDPLFVFKAGYAHKLARLKTYGRVHHRALYDRLCRLKEAHELATSGRLSSSDFFPLYRR